jgi:N-acetyl-anhydromuramyl-L-alanine amidase AmpD
VTHPSIIKRHNWGELTEHRLGVMLHYDASYSDKSSVAWLASAEITVSYNWIVMDSGNIIPIAPLENRAWHAGCCKSDDPRLPYHDANSAFYGVSIAATEGDVATREAKTSIADLCVTLFGMHEWTLAEIWRIVSHGSQAVYCKGHPRAGQRGRKHDPEGPNKARPVMNTNEIRGMVATRLAYRAASAVV